MPIYEYRCERGHTFEVMQRMTDDPVTSCSTCDAPVERVFHPVAVHFKGSGFYTTDYAKGQGTGSSDSTSSESPSKDSSKKDDSGKKKGSSDSGSKGSSAGSKDAD